MRRLGPSVRRAALLALLLPCELPLAASASDGPKPVTSYGDGSGELARLGKDIVHAAKEPNSAEYAALLASLTQTVPESWYGDVFGENSADLYGQYRPALPRLDEQLREFFAGVLRDGATDTTASKHVASCDDGSGELVYPVLALREKQVPLYELRFGKGKKLHRLWALAYMGGAFRFVGELKPVNVFP
ncbi:MAG TPA: hypothetical protein VEH49_01540, partial [Methylomirabilota bacterium]|nr:hypothetical protein [Methylomirabilota bacterium]